MSEQISESTDVLCAICKAPIHSRNELLIKHRGLKLTPYHYMCHAQQVMESGEYWQKGHYNVVNTFWMNIITPANWFWSLLLQSKAYLKFRRKIEK